MSIQSSVNQGLSLFSLLASQSPLAETGRQKAAAASARKQRTRETEQQFELEQQAALEGREITKFIPEKEAEAKDYERYAETAYQRYKADPSVEKYEDYRQISGEAYEYRSDLEKEKKSVLQKQEENKKKAQESLAAEQARLAESERIRKQILDIGGVH